MVYVINGISGGRIAPGGASGLQIRVGPSDGPWWVRLPFSFAKTPDENWLVPKLAEVTPDAVPINDFDPYGVRSTGLPIGLRLRALRAITESRSV